MSKDKQSRVFTASLKPVWSVEQINTFLDKNKGVLKAWIINHDRDTNNETGEMIEEHTHVLIEYDTPRKISTVSNVLEVPENFIEMVANKNAMLRYLTHMNDLDKYQYDSAEVFTNDEVAYLERVKGMSMSDKEIAEYIKAGRGFELLNVVSASKLRTIQSFLHFDTSRETNTHLIRLNAQIDEMASVLLRIDDIVKSFINGVNHVGADMVKGMHMIANELATATKQLRGGKK